MPTFLSVSLVVMGSTVTTVAFFGLVGKLMKPHIERWLSEFVRRLIQPIEDKTDEIQSKTEAIHRTTTVNGGKNKPATMLDKIHVLSDALTEVSEQIDSATRAVGAVAVNQAYLSSRFDEHERGGEAYVDAVKVALEQQGIRLPSAPSSLPPNPDE